MRCHALVLVCLVACGGSAPAPAGPEKDEEEPAPVEPAQSERPANHELHVATAELAEEVGALATASGTDCEAFADGLDKLMLEKAPWIEEMKQRAAEVKASGEPMPEPDDAMKRRLTAAMAPVQSLAKTCGDNVRFNDAMGEAFGKLSRP